jgi:hypothetical protein
MQSLMAFLYADGDTFTLELDVLVTDTSEGPVSDTAHESALTQQIKSAVNFESLSFSDASKPKRINLLSIFSDISWHESSALQHLWTVDKLASVSFLAAYADNTSNLFHTALLT